jgi:hypothetical protein
MLGNIEVAARGRRGIDVRSGAIAKQICKERQAPLNLQKACESPKKQWAANYKRFKVGQVWLKTITVGPPESECDETFHFNAREMSSFDVDRSRGSFNEGIIIPTPDNTGCAIGPCG